MMGSCITTCSLPGAGHCLVAWGGGCHLWSWKTPADPTPPRTSFPQEKMEFVKRARGLRPSRQTQFFCPPPPAPRVWTPTNPPAEGPLGGGGSLEGGSGRGNWGGGVWEGLWGSGPGGSVGGVSRWGNLGWVGGGGMPPTPSVGQSQAPLTSPCPPSNHTITQNPTLNFAASWFGHASHVD